MSFFQRWMIKVFQWEYWPLWLFYFPINFYFVWLAIRSRSFFFFSASNPTIYFGGMIGERKSEIFNLIPQEYYPKTLLSEEFDEDKLEKVGDSLGYPLIAKPDVGERGHGVEIIRNYGELVQYNLRMRVPYLLQEFVNFPIELGVFYVRKPSEEVGRITSIVQKKFLSVIGDGESTIEDLLNKLERAQLQVDFSHKRLAKLLRQIPNKEEEVVVEQIGNHSRGTMFLDATKEADASLNKAFDSLAKRIDGFYYGRFDLKCKSFDDLRRLENFSIVELNGAGAEPAHIYEPGFSLIKAYKVVLSHFKMMAEVSVENRRLGVSFVTFRDGLRKLSDIRAYNKLLKNL